MSSPLNILEAIHMLEISKIDLWPFGFSNPHSYRGDYAQLGVEPRENAKRQDMLKCLIGTIGETFEGYKGGDFDMTFHTEVHLAEYGSVGCPLTFMMMKVMEGHTEPFNRHLWEVRDKFFTLEEFEEMKKNFKKTGSTL